MTADVFGVLLACLLYSFTAWIWEAPKRWPFMSAFDSRKYLFVAIFAGLAFTAQAVVEQRHGWAFTGVVVAATIVSVMATLRIDEMIYQWKHGSEAIKCPGCDLRLPEDDLQAQIDHMHEYHPEIIADRRRAAGFQQEDGRWVDTLASDD